MGHGYYRFKRTIATIIATALVLGTVACGGKTTASDSVSSVTSVVSTSSASVEKLAAKRTIEAEELEGSVTATSEGNTIKVVVGEHLESGQTVETGEESYVTLLLDSDMHVIAFANTRFNLVAEGSGKATKTHFELETGDLQSTIDRKLEDGESYEVSTPNAVMSVRGTIFTVSVFMVDGKPCTYLWVHEGVVEVTPKEGDGETFNAVEGDIYSMSNGYVFHMGQKTKAKLLSKKETTYVSNGDVWVEETVYDYDEDDVLTGSTLSANGEIHSKVEIECDQMGYAAKESHYGTDGTLYYTVEREFNGDGNILRETERSSDGSIITERLCSYDSDGNLREESMPEYPGEMRLPWHAIYEYDDQGHRIAKSISSDGGTDRYVWKYDSEGHITEENYNPDPITGLGEERRYNYSYDEQGNLLGYEESGNSDWNGFTNLRYTMEYDENGNLIKETIFDVAGNALYQVTEYVYEASPEG
ncbi:MAG: FecR family protein [Lachnospiraceae bacterium]|nr:FecR family protein [Lachnospiraceae bacterium]